MTFSISISIIWVLCKSINKLIQILIYNCSDKQHLFIPYSMNRDDADIKALKGELAEAILLVKVSMEAQDSQDVFDHLV